jgi:hypothetical protein
MSVTVANDGGAAGERTVAVTANGSTVASRTVALGPGETATVEAEVSLPPGEHAVAVDGVSAGTLFVTEQSTDSPPAADSDAGDPGAGESDPDPGPGADAGEPDPDAGADDASESVGDAPAAQGGPQQELANLGLMALPGVLVVAALGVTIVVLARRGARDDQ